MDDPVPKCHRKYRALTGFTSDSRTMAGGMISLTNDFRTQFGRLISPSSPRLFRHFSCKVLHNAEHVSAD